MRTGWLGGLYVSFSGKSVGFGSSAWEGVWSGVISVDWRLGGWGNRDTTGLEIDEHFLAFMESYAWGGFRR